MYQVLTEIGGGQGGDLYLAAKDGKRFLLCWLDDGRPGYKYIVYEAPGYAASIDRKNEIEYRDMIQEYLEEVIDPYDEVTESNIEW